jgi:hypothetical protein
MAAGSFDPGAATALINWGDVPLVFGIMAFCYSGHAVFPSIQNSMREPERFPAVLNVAYVVVASICTFLAVAGYYMYGNAAKDVITFNMRNGASTAAGSPQLCADTCAAQMQSGKPLYDAWWLVRHCRDRHARSACAHTRCTMYVFAGWVKALCASIILVNPIAKFALTIEPVALNVRSAVLGGLKEHHSYISRCATGATPSLIVSVSRSCTQTQALRMLARLHSCTSRAA